MILLFPIPVPIPIPVARPVDIRIPVDIDPIRFQSTVDFPILLALPLLYTAISITPRLLLRL